MVSAGRRPCLAAAREARELNFHERSVAGPQVVSKPHRPCHRGSSRDRRPAINTTLPSISNQSRPSSSRPRVGSIPQASARTSRSVPARSHSPAWLVLGTGTIPNLGLSSASKTTPPRSETSRDPKCRGYERRMRPPAVLEHPREHAGEGSSVVHLLGKVAPGRLRIQQSFLKHLFRLHATVRIDPGVSTRDAQTVVPQQGSLDRSAARSEELTARSLWVGPQQEVQILLPRPTRSTPTGSRR